MGLLWLMRHDAAHVLATAVIELYLGVKISIGPPVEDGFYYDFEFPEDVKLSEDDLERIEQKMREHVRADERLRGTWTCRPRRHRALQAEGQEYKVELIENLHRTGSTLVSLYRNGLFNTSRRGPHGSSTKRIKAFKLTSVAGAYRRGNADNQCSSASMAPRFSSKEELEKHLPRGGGAADHRKLGRELDLFMFSELSQGSAFKVPGGNI